MKKMNMVVGFVLAIFASACGGGGGDSKGSDCADTILCAADCTTQKCVDGCMADASAAGKKQAIALANCFERAGCEDDACLLESCGDEVDACGGLDLGKPEVMSKVAAQ